MDQEVIRSDWNNITQKKPLIIETKHEIRTIALSPDGKYVASAGGQPDNSIRIWNPITGKQVGNHLQGHTHTIKSICYSKCGKYLISCGDDKTIRRWNVETQQQIDQPLEGHEHSVYAVQYTPDQRYIVSCSYDKTIRLWNSETGKEHVDKRIQHENPILCLSLSPISNDVAIGDLKGIIKVYDYDRGKLVGSLIGHTRQIWSLQYSSDGRYLVSGSNDQAILIWNTISRELIASLLGHVEDELGNNVFTVNFSPDMNYIISGGADHTVRIWNRVTDKQIGKPLNYHNIEVFSAQYSLDGRYIITGTTDKYLRIMVAQVEMAQ